MARENPGRQVAVAEPTLPGIAEDKQALDLANAYHAQIEDYGGGKLALPKLPSPMERAILEQRLAELRSTFRPIKQTMAAQDRAVAALGRVFAGIPSLYGRDNSEMCVSYMALLMDLPQFAVEMACEDARRGRLPDHDTNFAPTSAKLYKVAEGYRDRAYMREVHPIERVLSVKMIAQTHRQLTTEQRESIHGKMKNLADELAGSEDPVLERVKQRVKKDSNDWARRKIDEEWQRSGLKRPEGSPISLSLAKQLSEKKGAPLRRERRNR